MRRGGKIGMRQPVSGKPIPVARQIADIAQMGADIDPRRMHESMSGPPPPCSRDMYRL